MDIEAFERSFLHRFSEKKKLNCALCLLIFVLGITSFIYKAAVIEHGVLSCFREMTVDAAMFSSVVSLIYAGLSLYELHHDMEFEAAPLYYLRLSAATAEFIVLIIVLIGFLPFIPAKPVLARYDMLNMHLLIPILTLLSFTFNDPPRGRLTPVQRLGGLCFLLLYSIGILYAVITGLVPQGKLPYFFLDVLHQPLWFTIFVLIFMYTLGYLLSWLFSWLNRKGSWFWYSLGSRKEKK